MIYPVCQNNCFLLELLIFSLKLVITLSGKCGTLGCAGTGSNMGKHN